MSDEPSSKRRKMDNKKYYKNQNKPKNFLEPGIRGFLATCNFREKDCVRECYNLLNEYADQQERDAAIESEKPQPKNVMNDSGTVGEDEEEEEDISSMLEKEIQTITTDKKFDRHRFQQVETKISNCIFIKTTIKDHSELGIRLVRDIAETKNQKTRYLQRIWPVDAVCKANIGDIITSASRLFDKVFLNTEPTTFSVMVNKRHNNTFDRMKTIQEIAELIGFKSPAHKVDLKNPKITVAIEIIKGLCCISLLPDYQKLKKYNVFELTQTKEEKPADDAKTGETPADEEKNDDKSADEPEKDGKSTVEPIEGKQVADEPKKDVVSAHESKPNESGDMSPDEATAPEANGEQ
ncbi:THUMP domain-containing protein 1 homolog [Sitodiplosis mosellana]|uniref:THUMP domain-containing protein 1 homolog n=1 Tax=Sitodiplosis mosellana TaxID=263140 RepID=UPI0024453151|nr:THUMP domain-containing protein 1 homolog [Sitodiplosis mosellana]